MIHATLYEIFAMKSLLGAKVTFQSLKAIRSGMVQW